MGLVDAVGSATEWAIDGDGTATALAELARELAVQITNPPMTEGKSAPPTAALAKELRATLEDLEGLRDGDDAEASLGVVLSTAVWDSPQSDEADAGTARRERGGKSGQAADAVAAVRGRRGARGSA